MAAAQTGRRPLKVTYQGETRTLAEWSERLGIRKPVLYQRLKAGYSPEVAFQPELPVKESIGWDTMITVRVSREQHAILRSAAHDARKSLNRFCLDALMEAAGVVTTEHGGMA